jgi:probable phosphoglycerate mutase
MAALHCENTDGGAIPEGIMLRSGITLYFVRHGETEWNRARRYQGQRDIPLNDTGRGQASRNGRVLAEMLGARAAALDYVASPLVRARETMEIMRRELTLAPLDYRTDDRLREIHYGHWEGELWEELSAIDPDGYAARQSDPWNWQPSGGESYRMLSDRVAHWLAEAERDAVVVAHGGVSKVLRGLVLQLAHTDIARLDEPQDKVLMVEAGSIRWL